MQGSKETDFAKRIWIYNYRIYDRYNQPVASFAVLADGNPDWRPQRFHYQALGCRVGIDFPIAKLQDYRDQVDNLLAQQNPFAIVTAAHLLTQRTRANQAERYRSKQKVVRLLYEKGWDKQEILDLFAVIDWMMRLPQGLDERFKIELADFEREKKMRYVTSVERLAKEEGIQEGIQKGIRSNKIEMLAQLIAFKFGQCPEWATEYLNNADDSQLNRYVQQVLTATKVEEVFA